MQKNWYFLNQLCMEANGVNGVPFDIDQYLVCTSRDEAEKLVTNYLDRMLEVSGIEREAFTDNANQSYSECVRTLNVDLGWNGIVSKLVEPSQRLQDMHSLQVLFKRQKKDKSLFGNRDLIASVFSNIYHGNLSVEQACAWVLNDFKLAKEDRTLKKNISISLDEMNKHIHDLLVKIVSMRKSNVLVH